VQAFEILLITLGVAVVIVTILRRLHLPPLLGYLIAGALVGPYGLGFLADGEQMRYIAEFGVVFLLFMIGLELSLPKLIAMRRPLLGLGGMQVLICTAIVMLVSRLLGLPWPATIAISGALALSSTAIGTKQLIDQEELHQPHGKLALSILLFQDLAAVPFLIIIPAMAATNNTDDSITQTLLTTLVIGSGIFILMLAAGRWLLRPLFHLIASSRSSELFMLAALLVVLGSAFLTEHFGLSLSLGAFLAGVMLAETEYVHQIESDIQPFRDILLGLFFISVGVIFNPSAIIEHWLGVSCIVSALIFGKIIIIAVLAKIAGSSGHTAIRAGIALAQGGEFGLVFLSQAMDFKVIDIDVSQLVIASIVLSMAIAPLLIKKSDVIASKILKLLGKSEEEAEQDSLNQPTQPTGQDHIIICGYGRVGQTLARFLEYEGIPFTGLDLDPVRLKEARTAAEPVFFGDGNEDSLKAAGIDKARLLITAFDQPNVAKKILKTARRLNPTIPILVRTDDDAHLESLTIAGATEVVPDKLESSLMLAAHMLILLGKSPQKAQQQVYQVKSNRYKMLRSFYEGEDFSHLEDQPKDKKSLHAVELSAGACAIGKTISDIATEKCPIQVASFSRNGYKCEKPSENTLLMEGDILVVEGNQEEIHLAEEKLLQG